MENRVRFGLRRSFGLLVFAILPAVLRAQADDRIYEQVDEPPELVKSVPPKYPEKLQGSGTKGVATVVVIIDQMGDIESVTLSKASQPEFGPAALDCVRRWRYVTGRREGQAVRVRLNVLVRFEETSVAAK